MSLALDTILLDTDSVLEVIVEIDSAKRTDGTLKTWYFSTNIRDDGPEEVFNYLEMGGTLGPLSQGLTEDLFWSGLAQNNPGNITLFQKVVDSDILSALLDYVFAGYETRILIGRVSDAYGSFVRFRTTTVAIDPEVKPTNKGVQATFQLSGALKRMLEESLIVSRYRGIPHAVKFVSASGSWSAPSNSAYNVTSFTVGLTFLSPTNLGTTGVGVLMRRFTSGTNRQFQLSQFHQSHANSGKIQADVSCGGVSKTIGVTSTSYLHNTRYNTIILSILDRTTGYLMVNGSIISTVDSSVLTASVDLPAQPITSSSLQNGIGQDWRFYNRYMLPEEARGIFSVRAEGDDLGVIGMWRADDNAGGTINDYSPTNNDATLATTITTDYLWVGSNQGEPEQAGQLLPLTTGEVINAKADLIDVNRKRLCYNDGPTIQMPVASFVVKSQGTQLVLTTDYTLPANTGFIDTVSSEAEPITFDHRNGSDERSFYAPVVAYDVLIERTRIDASQIRSSKIEAASILCPWPAGYFARTETTAQQFLQEILGQSGLHYYEDEEGLFVFDFLIPPFGYGAYNNEPCLDLGGETGNNVNFGDVGDISSSGTVACWLTSALSDQTATSISGELLYMIAKSNTSGNYALWLEASGSNAGKIGFRIAGTTLYSPGGLIEPYKKYFIAGVLDDAANLQKIYVGKQGGTLIEVASVSNSSSPTIDGNSLDIGGDTGRPLGVVQHAQVWTVAKSLAQLQSLMATPPVGNEANLPFYAPLNEGSFPVKNLVSGLSGTINGSPKWAPKFTVDLDVLPRVVLTDYHHVHPASEIIVKFAKNRFPMEEGDIDSGVSSNNRLLLKKEGLEVRIEDPSIKSLFKHAKKIVLDSAITDRESAQRLLRALSLRFTTDRYVGQLQFPSDLNESRLACGLQIGDEIGIQSSIPSQLQTRRSFRVVHVSPNPLQLSTNVIFWG